MIIFIREIEKLKKMILSLSAMVEKDLSLALEALESKDSTLAQKVIEQDAEIDENEIDVEEECLKILVLHQPVATDLRFIIAVLKINDDLERIADLAVNIAERTFSLAKQDKTELPFDLRKLSDKVRQAFKESLDSLVNLDIQAARRCLVLENEIDVIHREHYQQVKTRIHQAPEYLDSLMDYLSVSRYLERIADHSKKIAQDVIYLVEGEIARHRPLSNV